MPAVRARAGALSLAAASSNPTGAAAAVNCVTGHPASSFRGAPAVWEKVVEKMLESSPNSAPICRHVTVKKAAPASGAFRVPYREQGKARRTHLNVVGRFGVMFTLSLSAPSIPLRGGPVFNELIKRRWR